MSRWLRDPRSSWLVVAALLMLLGVLGTLQFRWLGEVSQAQRDRMRASLDDSIRRFVFDFDGEITRAFLHFQPDSRQDLIDAAVAGRYADELERWRSTAPHPELVRDILKIELSGLSPTLFRLQPETASFERVDWIAELEDVHQLLERGPPARGRFGDGPPFSLLAPEIPAILVPRLDFEQLRSSRPGRSGSDRPGSDRPDSDRPETERPDFRSLVREIVVIRLDLDFLRDRYLPLLGARYLGSGDADSEYLFAVLSSEETDRWVYRSDPESFVEQDLDADLETALFALLPPEETRRIWHELRHHETGEVFDPGHGGRRRGRWMRPGGPGVVPLEILERASRGFSIRGEGRGGWKLLVRHREGSLDAAVGRAQQRSLFIGFGVLMLLGLAAIMLLVATRRAQALAAQQVEFVAGITHELRTPLAAIRSLAQNLADGIVEKPAQARQYGQLIEREGSRLSSMVEQVLELSGILSARKSYDFEEVAPAEIAEQAIADCQLQIAESGCRVERRLAEGPRVWADRSALRRAIQNLVANAVKYGGEDGEVRVEVEALPREVAVRVSDRGPGIPEDELPDLFRAFFRGREASADQIAGSGLGLSLVQHVVDAHDGRVEVDSSPGVGSTFSVFLPRLATSRSGGH